MPWNLTGNSDATTSSFLGTTNVQPLVIKTNGAEALRVTSDGKLSIGNFGGPRSPEYRLDVQGVLNADEIYKGGVLLVESQWNTVGGGITYDGGEVGIGARVSGYKLNVEGTLNATYIHKGGAPLVGSQWEEGESGGISYSGGSVGIGTINASYKLNVDGTINATEYRKNGSPLVGSQWTDVSGVGIRYNALVGLGKAPASLYKLDVAGSINATDIHKNGKSLVESQWTNAASGDISYVGGKVGIGTSDPQGKVDVRGDIRAGNSDIYFTRTDHNHTGIGNTAGYAALENAADYGALMILGRAGTPRGRYVRLWDYLQVNGGMDVTGNVEFLSGTNPIRVSSGWTGFPDAVTNQAEISNDTGTYKTLMIVGNRSAGMGRRVSVWDRFEVNGSAFKPGGGSWSTISDVRVKKCIMPLKGALEKLSRLRGVSFEWKKPEEQGNLTGTQIGLVAQEVEEVFPEWISTDPSGYKNLTIRGFEALAVEAFRELEDRIKCLESAISERNGSATLPKR